MSVGHMGDMCKKRLNRLRCRLGLTYAGPRNHELDGDPDHHVKGPPRAVARWEMRPYGVVLCKSVISTLCLKTIHSIFDHNFGK